MSTTAETGGEAPVTITPALTWRDDAFAITGPIVVHSRADIASILRSHRIAQGMTCEELDARAGFSDRYVTKMEHGDAPQGRKGFHLREPRSADDGGDIRTSFMADVWLETMGLRLVLMPADVAERIGAVPAPKRG